MSERVLVYGVGVAGAATAKALVARGYSVVAVDDDVTAAKRSSMSKLGVELVESPTTVDSLPFSTESTPWLRLPAFPRVIPSFASPRPSARPCTESWTSPTSGNSRVRVARVR